MRKRLIWLAAAPACVAVIGLFACWLGQRGRQLDKFAIEQIRIGMTEDEVVRLVGMQPGDYRTAAEHVERSRNDKAWWTRACGVGTELKVDGSSRLVHMNGEECLCPPERIVRQWRTNLRILCVIFDDRGALAGFYFHSDGTPDETSFDRLRRWLKL
jgi:hypothetical protein